MSSGLVDLDFANAIITVCRVNVIVTDACLSVPVV
ncbi:hypothetical protein EVA_19818 [gut metagenome]|uniref:Uncharacterized protein n=1 Tax=gut metagenome TaxID=749906 RepID=J9FB16_9ZZZZ